MDHEQDEEREVDPTGRKTGRKRSRADNIPTDGFPGGESRPVSSVYEISTSSQSSNGIDAATLGGLLDQLQLQSRLQEELGPRPFLSYTSLMPMDARAHLIQQLQSRHPMLLSQTSMVQPSLSIPQFSLPAPMMYNGINNQLFQDPAYTAPDYQSTLQTIQRQAEHQRVPPQQLQFTTQQQEQQGILTSLGASLQSYASDVAYRQVQERHQQESYQRLQLFLLQQLLQPQNQIQHSPPPPQPSMALPAPSSAAFTKPETQLMATAATTETSTSQLVNRRSFLALGIDEDHNWLSRYHCFVRSELLEVFMATEEDRSAGRIKTVKQGQIGIRCVYCAHIPTAHRGGRSTAFPSRLAQLYQSFSAMLRDHFQHCPHIPAPVRETLEKMKDKATHGVPAAKEYWTYAAEKLGLADSESRQGIIRNEETIARRGNLAPFGSAASLSTRDDGTDETLQGAVGEEGMSMVEPTLVLPRPPLTFPPLLTGSNPVANYLVTILNEAEVVRMTTAEVVGNRRYLSAGTTGLACRYCSAIGRRGSSRIFPGHRRMLLARLQDLEDHLLRCSLCPSVVKHELTAIRDQVMELNLHQDRAKPIGTAVKALIDVVWQWLRPNEETTSNPDEDEAYLSP